MLNKDIQEFAKRTGFKKPKNGYTDKQGFLVSESEITNFYNEVQRILNNDYKN